MLYGETNWMFARVCCQALQIIRDGFFCPLLQSKQALAKRFHADWRQTMMSIIFIHFNLFADSKWASNNVHRFQLISTFRCNFVALKLFYFLSKSKHNFNSLNCHFIICSFTRGLSSWTKRYTCGGWWNSIARMRSTQGKSGPNITLETGKIHSLNY